MAERSILRDFAGVFGTNVFSLLVSIIVGITLSRILGPEGRGIYATILVLPSILVRFATLGTRRSTIFHIGKKKFSEDKIISALISLLSLSTILSLPICAFIFYYWDNPDFTTILVILALLSIPVRMVIVFVRGIYIGKDRFRSSNFLSWVSSLLHLITIVVFVLIFRLSIFGALFSLFLSNLLIALYGLILINKEYKIKFEFDFEIIKSLFYMGLIYAIALLFLQLNYRIDIILIERLHSIEEVGFYSLAVSIAEQLWLLPASIGIIVMSRSAIEKERSKELNESVAKLIRVSFLLGIILSIVLFLIVPFLIPLLYGSEFIPSIKMLQYILPAIVFTIIARIIGSRFGGIGKPKFIIMITIPSLAINIILNYLWIPKYGGIGAAMASNVSYIIIAISLVIVYTRYMKYSIVELFRFRGSDFNFIWKIKSKIFK